MRNHKTAVQLIEIGLLKTMEVMMKRTKMVSNATINVKIY